jgi:hypothetical protein
MSPHISFKFVIIEFTNSRPLSEWNIAGAPNIVKISIRFKAIFSTLFVFKDFKITNVIAIASQSNQFAPLN